MTSGARASQTRTVTGQLHVLATTDLHCNLLSHDYYADRPGGAIGLSRAATLINRARAEAGRLGAACLLVDNGDGFQGSPLGDIVPGTKGPHPLARAFRFLKYDAVGLGNHDFDFGLEALARVLKDVTCPVLCASLTARQPDLRLPFAPSAVLERKIPGQPGLPPVRIGLFSVLPPQTLAWCGEALQAQLAAGGIVETAAAQASQLKAQGCDLVLALAHTGIDSKAGAGRGENELERLAALPEIDAVVGGHTHLTLPDPAHPFAKPVVMPGAHGSHLGVLRLELEHRCGGWRPGGGTASLQPVGRHRQTGAAQPLVPEEPDFAGALAEDHARTLQRMRQPAGFSPVAMHSYFTFFAPDRGLALVGSAQAAAVRSMLDSAGAQSLPLLSAVAPSKFGGRSGPHFYTDIAAGDLCVRNIADLQIFHNELRVVAVTGAQLLDWLEMSAGLFSQIAPGSSGQLLADPQRAGHNFDVIFGLSYQIDPAQPPRFSAAGVRINPDARRIRKLCWNGRPVEPGQRFAVAVNSYRVCGGGSFGMLQKAEELPLPPMRIREAIRDYIAGRLPADPLAEAPYPWQLAPMPGTSAVAVTGPGAAGYLEELPAGLATPCGHSSGGFLELELRL
ncbi:5'-nucleotidase C-terminal domain-containing protein [Leisingera methylohalidivorans]|uniref:2', 3'-cyclic nucleotide 2'-phosphodiesterase n=1 Tax=Leisingera methylohalidivorans DSM 14336 TaxID=999552 RepID=V9VR25_9RHOB|nr:5'-nucleotidase C-terminal domain-containing protein [Leisingera methylohalidivorans]AHC99754.1 2', 3'-cyclic nucleotide 2'-phosphodiesterase [Leisingera methylohalidivorans DSM 14336]